MLFEKYQKKYGFSGVITLLFQYYILQGLLLGYVSAMSVSFQASGISLSQQGTLSIITYPFIFKIFIAPFLDVYFIEKVKTRKYEKLEMGLG